MSVLVPAGTVFLMGALVIAGCGGNGADRSTEDTGGAQPASSGPSTEASLTIKDENEYSYHAEYLVTLGEPTLDVANAPPGQADLEIPVSGTLTVTNSTPGRNLQAFDAIVSAAFRTGAYSRLGRTPAELQEFIGCNNARLCVVAEAQAPEGVLVPAGEQITVPLESHSTTRRMSEQQAETTVELIQAGTEPTLMVVLDPGSSVSECTGALTVFIRQEFSLEPERGC